MLGACTQVSFVSEDIRLDHLESGWHETTFLPRKAGDAKRTVEARLEQLTHHKMENGISGGTVSRIS